MFDSFFRSLVDGRTLHANVSREPSRATEDPLSLALAVQTYKFVERTTDFGRRVIDALHADRSTPRPLGCG
jgi:hypothetical protein